MRVLIGSDHGGFNLKEYLKANLKDEFEIIDKGCFNTDSCDYPLVAKDVCEAYIRGEGDYGILICTNGVGITMVGNKFKGVRCALCLNEDMAMHAKLHNDANFISLGEKNTSFEEALNIVKVFLQTEFSNEERHSRRVKEIINIEEKN